MRRPCLTSAVLVGQRVSGESPHLFHQHDAQQACQSRGRRTSGREDGRTLDAGWSRFWACASQTQGEDKRDQWGVYSDVLWPSVLIPSASVLIPTTQWSHIVFTGLLFSYEKLIAQNKFWKSLHPPAKRCPAQLISHITQDKTDHVFCRYCALTYQDLSNVRLLTLWGNSVISQSKKLLLIINTVSLSFKRDCAHFFLLPYIHIVSTDLR